MAYTGLMQLIYKTRMTIQDTGRPFADNIICDGLANVFDLSVESISSYFSPPTVVYNGVPILPSAIPSYTWDYKYGVLVFSSAPPQGTTLGVQGWTYDYFLDNEVYEAVNDAFMMHTADLEPELYLNPLPGQQTIAPVEQILVAYLAAIELLWFRSTDASQEVDVHTPEGVLIPRSQRFSQMTEQVANLQAQYQTQAAALGVGLWRIQVLNQRRVSYTTNRLVPLFREQEYNQPYTGFYPTAANVGSTIQIWGWNFNGTTAVSFGGVSTTDFYVQLGVVSGPDQPNTPDQITVVVPAGALTGQIGVMTPYGEVLSTAQFVVGQPAPFILYGPEQVTPPIPPGL